MKSWNWDEMGEGEQEGKLCADAGENECFEEVFRVL